MHIPFAQCTDAKYNGALRFFTGASSYTADQVAKGSPSFVQKQCESDYKLGAWQGAKDGSLHWKWHNRYTTTIHGINSLIIKSSKLTVAAPVYRGLSGATLPKGFFTEDEDGLTGGTAPI